MIRKLFAALACCLLAATPAAAELLAPTHFGLFFGLSNVSSSCTDPRVELDDRIAACRVLEAGALPRNEHAAVLFSLGKALRDKGDYAGSEDAFNKILDLESDPVVQSFALVQRGLTLAAAGQYDKAMADADAALALQPDDPVSFNNRCWIRALAGKDLDAAQADCEKALALKDMILAHDSLGLVELRQGKLAAALKDFDGVLDAVPRYSSSLYLRSLVKRRMGDAKGADADLAAAKETAPHVVDIFSPFKL